MDLDREFSAMSFDGTSSDAGAVQSSGSGSRPSPPPLITKGSGNAVVRQYSNEWWSPASTSPTSPRRDTLTPSSPVNIPGSSHGRTASAGSYSTSMSASPSAHLSSSPADRHSSASSLQPPNLDPVLEDGDGVLRRPPSFAASPAGRRPTTAGSQHSGRRSTLVSFLDPGDTRTRPILIAKPADPQRSPSQPFAPSPPHLQVPGHSSPSIQTRQSSFYQAPPSPSPSPSTPSVPGRPRSVTTASSSSRSNGVVDALNDEFVSAPSVVTDRRPLVNFTPCGQVRAGTLVGLLAHLVDDNGGFTISGISGCNGCADKV